MVVGSGSSLATSGTGLLRSPSSTAGSFLKLAIHAVAIAFAFAANPLPRGSGAFLGRARGAVVGLLAAAAAFGAYDLDTLFPGAAWKRPTNSPLIYGGLFAIVVGELLTMLGLGSARPPAGGAGAGLPEAAAAAPVAAKPVAA